MITCGDSITVGTGASPSSKSWVGLYTPVVKEPRAGVGVNV